MKPQSIMMIPILQHDRDTDHITDINHNSVRVSFGVSLWKKIMKNND